MIIFSVDKVRKILILTSSLIVLFAVLFSYICRKYESVMVVMDRIVDIFGFMPLDRWASGSSFPDIAAVYYLLCSPLVLLFLLLNLMYATSGGCVFHKRNMLIVFAKSVFLLLLSVLLLVLFDGDGYWKYRIGEAFWLLLATGWVHMALPGWLLGEALRPIFFRHENTGNTL